MKKTFKTKYAVKMAFPVWHLFEVSERDHHTFERLVTEMEMRSFQNSKDAQAPLTQLLVAETLQRNTERKTERKKETWAKIMEFICFDHQLLSVVLCSWELQMTNVLTESTLHSARESIFMFVCLLWLYQTVDKHVDSLMSYILHRVFLTVFWISHRGSYC